MAISIKKKAQRGTKRDSMVGEEEELRGGVGQFEGRKRGTYQVLEEKKREGTCRRLSLGEKEKEVPGMVSRGREGGRVLLPNSGWVPRKGLGRPRALHNSEKKERGKEKQKPSS